jgi:hypothetical protein
MALVLLQTLPAVAGLILVFFVYSITRLIDVCDDATVSKRERDSYAFLARASAFAITVNVAATFVVWGWLRGWWEGFSVVTALFMASMIVVVLLTILALARAGALGPSD